MRKWIALLLAGLLMSISACALAFDLSAYEIHANEMLLEYGVKRNHTAAVERSGDRQELIVFDGEGNLVCRRSMGANSGYDVAASADHPQGGYLIVLVKHPGGYADELMSLWRLDAEGNVLWDSAIPKGFSWNWDILCDDGQGGAFFVFADPNDYKLAQVWHWDAQGNLEWNRVIEAQGLIFSGFAGRFDAQKDRLVVAGHAVSKSKGIYDAITLEIDRDGNMEVVQRKDFSCRPDYGFTILMDESGRFYAHSRVGYLNTNGTPRVLVPLDELPDAQQRNVVLRAQDAPSVYYYNPEGGRMYHVQARCGSIDAKYYPSIRELDAKKLNQPPYDALMPCSYCGADR